MRLKRRKPSLSLFFPIILLLLDLTHNNSPLSKQATTHHRVPLVAQAAASSTTKDDNNDSSSVANKKKKKKKLMRICLLPASFPWTFGPYQTQMYKLSLLLADLGYETLWMTRSEQSALPEGLYNSWEQIKPYHPKCIDPPPNFKLSHLKFVGRGPIDDTERGVYGKNAVFASKFNAFAKKYKIEAFITLLDLGQIIPDVPFEVPVVGWVPLHSGHIPIASPDRWTLKHFHAIASLSPSSTQDIQSLHPKLKVQFVPHIIERDELEQGAQQGLRYLKHASPEGVDMALVHRMDGGDAPTLPKHRAKPHLLFSGDEDTFMVLLQGGNYDSQDRKSWDTSIQAFTKFYKEYIQKHGKSSSDNKATEEKKNKLGKAHLYIHSMESYIAEADVNDRQPAPPAALPLGILLNKRLYEAGLPREAYTLDIAQHQPQVVAAVKKRANVCLHPSKVEGFGMNMVECQALGTPVITNNHTAMGDFTKLGISVPPKQKQYVPGGIGYEFALPYVQGLADALGKLYEEHVLLRGGEPLGHDEEITDEAAVTLRNQVASTREMQVQQTLQWIDDTFSPTRVGQAFHELLQFAPEEMKRREGRRLAAVQRGLPPRDKVPFYAVATRSKDGGDQLDIVETTAPWVLIPPPGLKILQEDSVQFYCWALLTTEKSATAVLVMPVKYEDTGEEVQMISEDGAVNSDLPVLIRTYILTALQNQTSRRRSIVYFAIQHAQSVNALQRMPDELGVIARPELQDIVIPPMPSTKENGMMEEDGSQTSTNEASSDEL